MDFPLVLSSNLGPTLLRFRDIRELLNAESHCSGQNLEVFPLE